MIVDSNVIIHFLRNDVPSQVALAKGFFQKVEDGKQKGEISILVLDEVIWALGQQYKISRSIFLPALAKILAIRGIEVIEIKKELISNIFEKMVANKIDFTDLYLMEIAKEDEIFTFDRDFKK